MKAHLWLIVIAACSSTSNGGGNPGEPDAKIFMDAPPVVPTQLAISGTAAEQGQSGSTPLTGVAIALYKVGADSTALATATTGGQGNYSLTLMTDGKAIDCYVKASKSG